MHSGKASASAEITIEEAAPLLDPLSEIVAQASGLIASKSRSAISQRHKADGSPVTEVDLAAEAIILEGVERLLPGIDIIAEESYARAPHRLGATFILVDPLDGTKEFLAGRDEFTVNLAIVTRRTPVLGIIAAPALNLLWRGITGIIAERLHLDWNQNIATAERRRIQTRPASENLVALTSRSHLDQDTERCLARLPVAQHRRCGSSLKFCHLAQGDADVYPRFSPTREWDIAAGCALLAAAGGVVTAAGGAPLQFGNVAGAFALSGFIAWGDPARAR